MWRYSEFISVREDFIPVFSEDVDRKHQDNWKSFIPHAQMRDLLTKLVVSMERASTGDCRSLWLSGAYGTGKTYASFVVKHLLQDDYQTVEEYLRRHEVLMPLRERFLALRRKGRHLVIYRSASGHISSVRRLMLEIEQAIKEQLVREQLPSPVSATLVDSLIERLSDGEGILNWPAAFARHRGRFLTVQSASEVVERLRRGDLALAETVASVLESEGLMFLDSPSKVKEWVSKVIEANDLKGIVFIWDEFTEFFSNNLPVTPLQELAQATADTPFYLFLVTHRSLSQFTRIDEETQKKLLDRFHSCHLDMNPVTAYRLISNVIEVVPASRSEWESKRNTLWTDVESTVTMINVLGERVGRSELMAIMPMHPFTAYLLSNISSQYSSSQRTLFRFLKEPKEGSFQWFIADFPSDDWYWQTVDYLWVYFFESQELEDIGFVNDLLSYSRKAQSALSSDALRVLRVILLLTALDRQTRGAPALLRPALSNLKYMFAGTPVHLRIAELADELAGLDLVRGVKKADDVEYIIPTATIDQTKLEQCRQRAKSSLRFEKTLQQQSDDRSYDSILGDELLAMLELSGAAGLRHPVLAVSAPDLRNKKERCFTFRDNPSEIGLLFVLARFDEDLANLEELAVGVTGARQNCVIMIHQEAFGKRRWDDWLEHRAHSLYHSEARDASNQAYYDAKSREAVRNWQVALRTGQIRAFFRGEQHELAGCSSVVGYMSRRVSDVFPYGPERINDTATLYEASWGKAAAEYGLEAALAPREPLKSVIEALKSRDVWDRHGSGRVPGHPLTEMQSVVDRAFDNTQRVMLAQLWRALQEPPFGLMPSAIAACLFGVLLREYAVGYYYSDGINSLSLNASKLAELVTAVIKQGRGSTDYSIRKMSPKLEYFCLVVRVVFELSEEATGYPEEARKNLRKRILDLGYPLWAALHDAGAQSQAKAFEPVVMELCHVVAYDTHDVTEQDVEKIAETSRSDLRHLRELLCRQHMQEGMRDFILTHSPSISELQRAIGLTDRQVVNELKTLLAEDVYLWKPDRLIDKLPELSVLLSQVDALNRLMGACKQTIDELKELFYSQWFRGKLPVWAYGVDQADGVRKVLLYLEQLVTGEGRDVDGESSRELCLRASELPRIMADQIRVVRALASKHIDNELSDSDAQALLDNLPDLRRADEHKVDHEIQRATSYQARQALIHRVRTTWSNLSGSDSPTSWSAEKGVPIEWVIPNDAVLQLFDQLGRVGQLTEPQLISVAQDLDECASDLAVLRDDQEVMARFVERVSGPYRDLVEEIGQTWDLKTFVGQRVGGDVHRWPSRVDKVWSAVAEWVNQHYSEHALPRVEMAVDAIPDRDIREFLKEFARRDALVGAHILKLAGSLDST